jgi:endonuclease G, mitochondrial
MQSPFCRRFAPAFIVLLALTIGPLLASTSSQVSVSIHIPFGNVSDAKIEAGSSSDNLLVTRPQFAASWNASKRIANWVAWRLRKSDIGSVPRSDFYADESISTADPKDYTRSGYDRGHLCPSADRTDTPANNRAVFTMLNIIPQAPDNNQGPWQELESHTRSLAQAGRETYIIAGGVGSKDRFKGITVPEETWKVIIALQPGKTYPDVANATVIAILMPNVNGIKNDDWQKYKTTVAAVASKTEYDFSKYPQQ